MAGVVWCVLVVEVQLQLRGARRREGQIDDDWTNESGMTPDGQSPLTLLCALYAATRPLGRAQLAKLVIREMQMSSLCRLDGNGLTKVQRGDGA